MRFWTPKIAHLLFVSLLLTTPVAPTSDTKQNPGVLQTKASVESSDGLNTAVFETKAGTVRVNLPDDMAAGDSISGTVYLAPSGSSEKERSANFDVLESHVVVAGGRAAPASARIFKFDVPVNPAANSVPVFLRDSKGRQVSGVSVGVTETFVEVADGEFQIPDGGQTGRWINILGSFDSDLANTALSIGGSEANPLAESPRKSVFQSPADVIGITELAFREGNTEIEKEFRNIDVRLSAAKLKLQRGETTNVTLNVSGLSGIEDDLPLHLTCSGSADMQGGNIQNLQIPAGQVNGEGIFTQTRTLVGNQVGNFNVTATVLFDVGVRVLDSNLLHIEGTPKKMGNNWGVRAKTLDGKNKWVFFDKQPPGTIKACVWIRIKKSTTDEDGDYNVSDFETADDPTKPCQVENKTVHVEGDPIQMPDGRWRITITTPDGKRAYVFIRAPKKPDLKLCNWIKLSGCKKLSSNTFDVAGYTKTEDPNKPAPAPAAPTPTPTPTPTPDPTPDPPPTVAPCTEGAVRNEVAGKPKTFEILSKGSQLSFSIKMNNGGGQAAAAGMAAWLGGIAELGSILTGNFVPDDQALGGGVADAALKYVELGGDIIGALAKSKLGNSRVSEVSGTLSTRLIKVTTVCTSYEVCIKGTWIKKKSYSEEREIVDYSRTKFLSATNDPRGEWKNVTNSSTSAFDIDKAEKYLMEQLLKDLKRNEENYGKAKAECK